MFPWVRWVLVHLSRMLVHIRWKSSLYQRCRCHFHNSLIVEKGPGNVIGDVNDLHIPNLVMPPLPEVFNIPDEHEQTFGIGEGIAVPPGLQQQADPWMSTPEEGGSGDPWTSYAVSEAPVEVGTQGPQANSLHVDRVQSARPVSHVGGSGSASQPGDG